MNFQPFRAQIFSVSACFLVLFFGQLGIVAADDEQEPGVITSFQTFTPGSDEFSMFRGKITLKEKKGNSSEYAFGGSACPAKDLSESQQNFLVQVLTASRNPQKLLIKPFTKSGQGGNVCIVSYIISKPKFLEHFK